MTNIEQLSSISIADKDFYYYDSSDPVVSELKNKRLFGASNFSLLSQFILSDDPKEYIVDCGAHIGTFGFIPAINNSNVLMIEAAEKNFECLEKTFEHMTNVVLRKSILLDDKKKCNFSRSSGPLGSATQSDDGTEISDTLDNLVEGLDNPKICAIKYDIEGNEIDAIQGSIKTISKNKPVIMIEINGYCLLVKNKSPNDLLNLIYQIDYIPFLVHNNNLIPIDSESKFPFCVHDAVCIHKHNIGNYINKNIFTMSLTSSSIDEIILKNSQSSNQECSEYFASLIK